MISPARTSKSSEQWSCQGIPDDVAPAHRTILCGRDTGDAQIFVNLIDSPRLDHTYTVFATVIDGMTVVTCGLHSQIAAVAAGIRAERPDARIGYLMTREPGRLNRDGVAARVHEVAGPERDGEVVAHLPRHRPRLGEADDLLHLLDAQRVLLLTEGEDDDGGGQRPYWDKVYLTGARFFEDLREQVGDEIFFTFLKSYYTQSVGRQVTSADFFRIFRETTAADITALLITYFKNTY